MGWVACLWGSEQLHALEGTQDAEIVREAGQFWHDEGMRQIRRNVVHDVNTEVDAGRLTWNYEDVYAVINPFPVRGKRYDAEPMDKGSDESGEEGHDSSQDDDDDHNEDDDSDARAPVVAGHEALQRKDDSASPSEQ